MSRLVLVDTEGGSLAALGSAMARLEGAPGFDEVVARTLGDVQVASIVAEVLQEIGVGLVPLVKPYNKTDEGDVVVSINTSLEESADYWSLPLAASGSDPLVVHALARLARDQLALHIAEHCARYVQSSSPHPLAPSPARVEGEFTE